MADKTKSGGLNTVRAKLGQYQVSSDSRNFDVLFSYSQTDP